MLNCDICGKPGHSWFDCPKRSTMPPGWKPERIKRPVTGKATTLASSPRGKAPDFDSGTAGSSPAEATKRGRGRPKTIADMKAYKAQKERERRARLKAEKDAGK